MKNKISLAVWLILLIGIQFLINCSNPLEGIDEAKPVPPGPNDTVDTIIDYDTILVVDTLTVVDTLIVTDTVIIVEPGPGDSGMVCARLTSVIQEIVWLFRNSEGMFKLEFAAAVERDHPVQTLTVDIDGEEFIWKPAEDSEFIENMHLDQNAVIRINPKKPPSLGHSIDICLTVTRL